MFTLYDPGVNYTCSWHDDKLIQGPFPSPIVKVLPRAILNRELLTIKHISERNLASVCGNGWLFSLPMWVIVKTEKQPIHTEKKNLDRRKREREKKKLHTTTEAFSPAAVWKIRSEIFCAGCVQQCVFFHWNILYRRYSFLLWRHLRTRKGKSTTSTSQNLCALESVWSDTFDQTTPYAASRCWSVGRAPTTLSRDAVDQSARLPVPVPIRGGILPCSRLSLPQGVKRTCHCRIAHPLDYC